MTRRPLLKRRRRVASVTLLRAAPSTCFFVGAAATLLGETAGDMSGPVDEGDVFERKKVTLLLLLPPLLLLPCVTREAAPPSLAAAQPDAAVDALRPEVPVRLGHQRGSAERRTATDTKGKTSGGRRSSVPV
ncbi:hypothetical protein F2P81_020037 [Scophthalmus maximus]|uniref:Uncharacterized protein n=1 Tax=Scophthalmus maximus TaxID=52904 RepID=A0A6A4RWV7_SCOMX|nr:hypothetical protein F2P81_020037 [Scophthalmus maximus]